MLLTQSKRRVAQNPRDCKVIGEGSAGATLKSKVATDVRCLPHGIVNRFASEYFVQGIHIIGALLCLVRVDRLLGRS